MPEPPILREITVTVRFVCEDQEQYDRRLKQVEAWVDELQRMTGEAMEGDLTIAIEDGDG